MGKGHIDHRASTNAAEIVHPRALAVAVFGVEIRSIGDGPVPPYIDHNVQAIALIGQPRLIDHAVVALDGLVIAHLPAVARELDDIHAAGIEFHPQRPQTRYQGLHYARHILAVLHLPDLFAQAVFDSCRIGGEEEIPGS